MRIAFHKVKKHFVMIFRKALQNDFGAIWKIIQYAKEVRKQEGSSQWQDGYPNEQTIRSDIDKGNGYVMTINEKVVAYIAIIFEIEPAYEVIEGQWLSTQPYAVVHRMAVLPQIKGKGFGHTLLQKAEAFIEDNNIKSIRIDTNYDNLQMLKILVKQGYTYCGEVYFRGAPRRAFEKIIITEK